MAGTKRKRAPQRREEVLQAALTLFAQDGYDQVVMDDIARACGIARTSLYEYFRSKEEILLAMIDEVIGLAPRGLPPGATCREHLTAIAAAELHFLQEHRVIYRTLFQKIPAMSGPTADKIQARRQEQAAELAAAVRAGITARELRPDVAISDVVFLFQSIVGQLGSAVLMTEHHFDPETEVERLIGVLFQGIGTAAGQ